MRYFILFLLLLINNSFIKADNLLQNQIQQVLQHVNAQVGVAIIIDGKDTLTFNNDKCYPLMSVMKYHQALAVVHYLEQHRLPLSTAVWIEKKDLLSGTYSPLRDNYPEGNIFLSIGELLRYTLQQSDNNACDILFRYVGGTDVIDKYIRSLGVEAFSISATEDEMHRYPVKCFANWSTPLAVVCLMDKLVDGTLPIDTVYTNFICKTLLECQTGKERLSFPLQGSQARIGHKTGTSDQDEQGKWIAINDVGFIQLPDGRRYTIAVLIKHSKMSFQETEKIIADISEVVYKRLYKTSE